MEAVRCPPGGRRGVGSALARSARWNRVDGYPADADAQVSLFVQIETVQGVDAAADIAGVEPIDRVFVGPSDLSASRGRLVQQNHPDVVAAVHRAFEAVRSAGSPVGVNAFDPALARSCLEAGASFVLVGADVALLARGSEALAAAFAPTTGRDTDGRPGPRTGHPSSSRSGTGRATAVPHEACATAPEPVLLRGCCGRVRPCCGPPAP